MVYKVVPAMPLVADRNPIPIRMGFRDSQHLHSALTGFEGREVPDTIKALEREIRQIEKRLTVLKQEKPASQRERKIHEATVALLGNVLKDLRKQQGRFSIRR